MNCPILNICPKINMILDKEMLDAQYAEAINSVCKICKEKGMTSYTGHQSVLDNILGKYSECGFSLKESGDHILELYHNSEKVADFNQTKVTIKNILEGCQNYLKSRT